MGLWFAANLLETLALTPFFWPEGPGHLKQLRFVWQCSEKWPERCGIIVSACRGLMELGGRLIECLPSFYLKCRNSATNPTTPDFDLRPISWRHWPWHLSFGLKGLVIWNNSDSSGSAVKNGRKDVESYIYIYVYIYIYISYLCYDLWFLSFKYL